MQGKGNRPLPLHPIPKTRTKKCQLCPRSKLSTMCPAGHANGIEIVKSTPAAVYPALSSQGIEPRALLKIAYEYLALHLGSKIFHQYFDPVRSAFQTGGVVPNRCSVQERRVRDRKYEPLHGLAVKNTDSGLVVKIRLFGYLSYPVHFFGLQIEPTKSHCYMLHLGNKQEEWGQLESA
jgi:hypothetical protein